MGAFAAFTIADVVASNELGSKLPLLPCPEKKELNQLGAVTGAVVPTDLAPPTHVVGSYVIVIVSPIFGVIV